MHYFQFNIGDYKSHTTHLSLLEDIAYRRLLDLYYLHERPLNSGVAHVARQIGMREHETEVQTVLEEFFKLTEDGWVNKRADLVIEDYRAKIQQASKAGKASAERRLSKRSTVVATDVQPNIKQETITKKQEPSSAKRPAKKCPKDFEVTDDMKTWVKTECPLVDYAEQTKVFRDYEFTAAKSDWVGTWRNWMRKANQFAAEKQTTDRYPKTSSGIIAGAI
ncbi:MAG: DUF1376 domain-containing protein [Actinobacteria bacterium]|nr:DUF1376 domain-containing protein [Actinomycetota bacterium]